MKEEYSCWRCDNCRALVGVTVAEGKISKLAMPPSCQLKEGGECEQHLREAFDKRGAEQ